jgi:chorismate mutase/prephenate dehydratase
VNPVLHFLGPEGTFAHAAALAVQSREYPGAVLKAVPTIVGVFEEVSVVPGSLGVVPIENSTEGSVSFTLDALLEHPSLYIIGEEVVEVEQCLLGTGALSTIKTVHSHPHGLAQCKRWLRANLPHASLVASSSTAAAALAVRGDSEHAAIASALAGQLAGLNILVRGVQDRTRNATRFLVLGHQPASPTGNDKTSLVFSTPHQQGALHKVLGLFAQHGINLSKIESRPMPDAMWQYVFFADLAGHQDDLPLASALNQLREHGHMLRVFGSYPTAPGFAAQA